MLLILGVILAVELMLYPIPAIKKYRKNFKLISKKEKNHHGQIIFKNFKKSESLISMFKLCQTKTKRLGQK